MRNSVLAASAMLLLGTALLLQPSPRVAAQVPAALTPSPEPPSPTTEQPTPSQPTVTPTPGGPPQAPPPQPPYPGPATATPRPRDEPVADLALFKSVSPPVALPGELLTFNLTLINRSADRADDVVVTDALPGVLGVYNATTTRGVISVSGTTVSVDIGRLEAGGEVGITVVAQVNAGAPPSGYANRASVSSSTEDRGTGDNVAGASFMVGQQATPVPPTPTATIPATPVPGTPVPATPTPPDTCVRAAAGGEPLPTCTPLPGTPAPQPTASHPPAPPTPQQLPDTGMSILDMLGISLVATGALGLGLALRRKVTR